jgi:hypothetical protein
MRAQQRAVVEDQLLQQHRHQHEQHADRAPALGQAPRGEHEVHDHAGREQDPEHEHTGDAAPLELPGLGVVAARDRARDLLVEPLLQPELAQDAVVEHEQQRVPRAVARGPEQARGDDAPEQLQETRQVLADGEAGRVAYEAWLCQVATSRRRRARA